MSDALGDNIRDARKRGGLSQRKAASEIGISFVYWNRIERGHENPSIVMLLKIAKGLGKTAAQLLHGVK